MKKFEVAVYSGEEIFRAWHEKNSFVRSYAETIEVSGQEISWEVADGLDELSVTLYTDDVLDVLGIEDAQKSIWDGDEFQVWRTV